ncbi:Fucose permease [Streptoalloteichus tenebrarius]|uniref:Fucose permease n=2 Tax=Streptoalloteichus tenebrarius (strain ATCC 17920 / DSM 40477 / JCM 4838 / CBS 697.72 / NBRC 16177 / NCIMB 11028 / NRRL B-12390 / A12253. 1 / ISP 5477) TaxID=1933 RepID=A0ABT1HPQ0_STRSD|nr:Fucose permease [Streptoalloteichus tenebrarius]BFE98445.1 MFS transporter [Streptoalloteichus tenebrarius]
MRSVSSPRVPDRASRVALRSVRLTFFLTGLLFATWAARTPSIKHQLGLDDGDLAVAFAGLNLGALLGLRLGGWLTPRFGSATTLRIAVPVFALSLSAVLLAGNLAGLAAALVVFAVANSVVDVAMNSHGVAVERRAGRSLLSGIHAWHSLGVISGSLLGAAAEQAHLSITAHFACTSVLVALFGVATTRGLLPSSVDGARSSGTTQHPGGRWPARLVALGALAFCVALAEGAANDWSAVYLHDEAHASSAVAAVGFGAFAGSMFLGRLCGDHLINRVGPQRAFLAGVVTAGAGMGAALLVGGTVAGLVGFALFGLGLSYTFPLTFAASGRVVGVHPTHAIANISTLGYLGFFTGPTVIGLVADSAGLTVGLAVPALVVLLAAFGVRAVRPPSTTTEGVAPTSATDPVRPA